MIEADWLASRDLTKLIRAVDPRRFDRKLRLLAVVCCRRVSEQVRDADAQCLLELTAKLADAATDPQTLRTVWEKVPFFPHAEGGVKQAAALDCASWQSSAECYRRAAFDAETAAGDAVEGDGEAAAREKYTQRGLARSDQIAFLRDVVGNPFRSIAFSEEWCTSTVFAIAQSMYESRDFSPIPILADALQDAGCENEEIVNHCRSAGPHVRGCWVVDLILQK